MLKKITLIALLSISLFAMGNYLQSSSVLAASSDPLENSCTQPGATVSDVCAPRPSDPITGSGGVLAKVLNFLLIAAGVISVIMIMVGGFEYVISTGDSGRVNTAKNTIMYAVIGLVIALVAEAILRYVVRQL